MQTEEFVLIGRLGKGHGLQGELKTKIEEAYLDDFLKAEVIFLVQKGITTPFFVDYIRGKATPLIKLEGINSRSDAALIQHADVKMRTSDLTFVAVEEEEEAGFARLVSYQLQDSEYGLIGPIEEIIESPQQQLAVVQFQGQEILIPLHEDFMQSIDTEKRIVYLSLPEGILSL